VCRNISRGLKLKSNYFIDVHGMVGQTAWLSGCMNRQVLRYSTWVSCRLRYIQQRRHTFVLGGWQSGISADIGRQVRQLQMGIVLIKRGLPRLWPQNTVVISAKERWLLRPVDIIHILSLGRSCGMGGTVKGVREISSISLYSSSPLFCLVIGAETGSSTRGSFKLM